MYAAFILLIFAIAWVRHASLSLANPTSAATPFFTAKGIHEDGTT